MHRPPLDVIHAEETTYLTYGQIQIMESLRKTWIADFDSIEDQYFWYNEIFISMIHIVYTCGHNRILEEILEFGSMFSIDVNGGERNSEK